MPRVPVCSLRTAIFTQFKKSPLQTRELTGTPKMSTTETFWGEEQPTDSGTACATARVVLLRESCDEVGRPEVCGANKAQKKNPAFAEFSVDAAKPYSPGPCPAKYHRRFGA